MASTKTAKNLLGQMFLVGFDGYSVPAPFKEAIQQYNIGGTIYFKRNVQSPAQLAELSNEIQFSCRTKDTPPLIISIDHEGGKVNRLVKPFTKFPGNDYLGEIGSPKLAFEFGLVIAKELKSIGINMNYAPVVDILTNPNNPVMKNRCFGDEPEICGRLGSAVSRGMQKIGVAAVAKHFPGHGDTKDDSHFTLPVLNKSLKELDELELIPFKRLVKSRVEAIMTAHILNKAIDPKYPATLSEKTIDGILRKQMRYNRLIISDDMEMKAISDNYGANEAALLAIKAGCDILIYRGDAGVPIEVIEYLLKAIEDKKLSLTYLEQANKRIQECKKTYATISKPIDVTKVGQFIGISEHFKLAEQITKKEKPRADGTFHEENY
jgi:beta-N-acetylhexosaminidase